MRAPMMAVVFAFELTHDANALLPLLTAAAVAYGFTVLVMRRSILTEKIARRGYHIYREYGIDPLERHHVDEVMTPRRQDASTRTPASPKRSRGILADSRRIARFRSCATGRLVGMIDRRMLATAMDAGRRGNARRRSITAVSVPKSHCRTRHAGMSLRALLSVRSIACRSSRMKRRYRLIGIVSRHDLVKPSFSIFNEEREREQFRSVSLTRASGGHRLKTARHHTESLLHHDGSPLKTCMPFAIGRGNCWTFSMSVPGKAYRGQDSALAVQALLACHFWLSSHPVYHAVIYNEAWGRFMRGMAANCPGRDAVSAAGLTSAPSR